MRPLWGIFFVIAAGVALLDVSAGVAGMVVFGALYTIGGRVDNQIESVSSTGSAIATGCLLVGISILALVVLFVLSGGREIVAP